MKIVFMYIKKGLSYNMVCQCLGSLGCAQCSSESWSGSWSVYFCSCLWLWGRVC